MPSILFLNYGDVIDTSLEPRGTLDIFGWMAEIVWIHRTRAFISIVVDTGWTFYPNTW